MESYRLLWLSEHYPPDRGGMAQSCDRILRGLRHQGIEIDLCHLSHRARDWEERPQAGGRLLLCPLEADPAHSLNRLWTRIEATGLDYSHVVAFGGYWPLLAGPVFSTWLERPLITLLRGNDFDAAVFSPRRTEILREALIKAAMVCPVSRDKVRKIRRLYPEAKLRWLPNGIDTQDWEAGPFDRTRAAEWRRLFVPAGRRVLGLFGRLKAKKGLVFFLEALLSSGLSERFHLLLVGEAGPEAIQWLERLEDRLSLTPLPFLDRFDLIPYLLACDFLVLPSFYDGMPNLMLEAMALGVPILASAAGGMADVLEDGRHGLVFTPGDRSGCQQAIRRAAILGDEDRQRMSAACIAEVRARLGAERETAAYLEVLRDTAKNPKIQALGEIAT